MNFFVLNTKKDILKKVCNQAVLGTIDFHSRKKTTLCRSIVPQNCSVSHILQNIFILVLQNKYILGTTWGWVNDDSIFIFAWTIPSSQGSPSSVLEGRCPAEFSSNPNQTQLNQLIKVLLGIFETSRQVCWGKLELNSAGHRPSRIKFDDPCFKLNAYSSIDILY